MQSIKVKSFAANSLKIIIFPRALQNFCHCLSNQKLQSLEKVELIIIPYFRHKFIHWFLRQVTFHWKAAFDWIGRTFGALELATQTEIRGLSTYVQYIPGVPQCLSPRLNWDPHIPSPASVVCSSLKPKGGGGAHSPDTRLRVREWGGGGPNSDDWRKSLVFCLHVLCR